MRKHGTQPVEHAATTSRRPVHGREVALHGVGERLRDQLVLGAEMVEDQARADAQGGGDVGDAYGGQADPLDLADRGEQDLLAAASALLKWHFPIIPLSRPESPPRCGITGSSRPAGSLRT